MEGTTRRRHFSLDTRPHGVIECEVDLTREQIEALRRTWIDVHRAGGSSPEQNIHKQAMVVSALQDRLIEDAATTGPVRLRRDLLDISIALSEAVETLGSLTRLGSY